MTALIVAVIIASLIGSLHCAGMCGPFLTFAVAPCTPPRGAGATTLSLPVLNGPCRAPRSASLHVAYNAGRLVTYTTLGAIAGALGAALDLGGSMVGVQRAAAVLAGGMMVVIGLVTIGRVAGVRVRTLPLPRPVQQLAMKGHRAAGVLPPFTRALVTGMLTTLLPCGWLYSFVITSAGAGHPLAGAATMAAFWMGTLPMMVGLGIGLQALTGSLRRHLPVATSAIIVLVGLWTIFGRLSIVGLSPPPSQEENALSRVQHLHADSSCPLCK